MLMHQEVSASYSALQRTQAMLQAAQGRWETTVCWTDPMHKWMKVRKKLGLGAQIHFLKLEEKRSCWVCDLWALLMGWLEFWQVRSHVRHFMWEKIIEKEWYFCAVTYTSLIRESYMDWFSHEISYEISDMSSSSFLYWNVTLFRQMLHMQIFCLQLHVEPGKL